MEFEIHKSIESDRPNKQHKLNRYGEQIYIHSIQSLDRVHSIIYLVLLQDSMSIHMSCSLHPLTNQKQGLTL